MIPKNITNLEFTILLLFYLQFAYNSQNIGQITSNDDVVFCGLLIP